ncbi:MAG: HAD family hydrolase [Ruminiclostridium sp.]|nr:HAD family hydrolase [Ruminiclostridium sp.]
MAQIYDFKNDYIGLDSERVEENIGLYGYNSDTRLDEKNKGYSPLRAFFNLRFLLMLAAAGVCLWYGISATEELTEIFAGVVMILLCGVFAATEIIKNTRCDKYFFELKARSKTEFRIVRDGEIRNIRRELIVPDDIIILSAGESVPADAHLLEIKDLLVDEGIFTGSKAPVTKIIGSDSVNEEIKRSCIYKGTKIVGGMLAARVTGTGVDTRFFKEFGAMKETEEYYTTLEKTVLRISGIFTAVAAVMLLIGIVAYINVRVDIPFMDMIFNTVYPAAAFALCFIPAETASLIRLYYIKGSQKLEEEHIWVKNLSTIEYINAASCILIDKSGMVTERNMQITDQLTANPAMLSNISILSCDRSPDDPFDKAIILNASFNGVDTDGLTSNEHIRAYPFEDTEGASGNLWVVGGAKLLCIKGTPDKLLPLCDVPNDMLYTVQTKQVGYAKQGYNVLAVAYAKLDDDAPIPEKISEAHYSFMGLIAFDNQTKDYIPAAIIGCRKAGAKVIMTTGDSPEAALAVANKVGIKGTRVVTGDMLMSGKDIDFTDVCAFARITADMKPEIIRRLQNAGEVVMITGETASDSDLLELADIGVSVAKDVVGTAFEESDVVAGNDSFETVTDIITTARQTHLNIKRCISTSMTALVAMIVFAAFNLLTGGIFVISPVVSSLLAVLIVPAAAMMYYDNAADIKNLTSPSVYIGSGKLRGSFFVRPLIQAVGLAFAEIVYYLISSGKDIDAAQLASLTRSGFLLIFVFGMLIISIANLGRNSFIDAFRGQQTFAWLIAGVAFAFSLVIVFVPGVNTIFGFGSPDIMSLLIAIAITVLLQAPAELIRMTMNKLKG